MELRVLRYFLAVVRAESISEAAEQLHITQPTLSRQIMDLEDSLGVQLFKRGRRNQKLTLTEAGTFLRRHAEEIVTLADRTEAAFAISGDAVTGDIYIGAGETDAVRLLARAAKQLQNRCPHVRYHISSGDGVDVAEQLDKGLIDFGVFLGAVDPEKYNSLPLQHQDTWGVLMRKDDPLAQKQAICPEDLWDKPLIVSRQVTSSDSFFHWLKKGPAEVNVAASYSLAFNASLMAEEGLGYALVLDKIINTSGDSSLCFRPAQPRITFGVQVVWKKHQVFSRAATLFLEELRSIISE